MWQQLVGVIKAKWGKLTDDDLKKSAGNREYLLGKLHEQYGMVREIAEKTLREMGHV